jgi:hypothetical protein
LAGNGFGAAGLVLAAGFALPVLSNARIDAALAAAGHDWSSPRR